MFKIRYPVLYFFLLKLRVKFYSIPSCVNKNSKVTKIFLSKNFKLS